MWKTGTDHIKIGTTSVKRPCSTETLSPSPALPQRLKQCNLSLCIRPYKTGYKLSSHRSPTAEGQSFCAGLSISNLKCQGRSEGMPWLKSLLSITFPGQLSGFWHESTWTWEQTKASHTIHPLPRLLCTQVCIFIAYHRIKNKVEWIDSPFLSVRKFLFYTTCKFNSLKQVLFYPNSCNSYLTW